MDPADEFEEFELVEQMSWFDRSSGAAAAATEPSVAPPATAAPLDQWLVVSDSGNGGACAETNFVDAHLLQQMKSTKERVFGRHGGGAGGRESGGLSGLLLRQARCHANRCELIGSGPFQNRAAVKMANIDARTGFMFSRPSELVADDAVLQFCDMCAGPGGFSEYVLWRRGWLAHGYGITLRAGDNDFCLDRFDTVAALNFSVNYGVGGVRGDGDVYREDNQLAFAQFVRENTGDEGVHVAMADGGFDVTGSEARQEIICSRLYLSQFLLALRILRPGGHFVCKLFDVFTDFSVSLIYVMSLAFGSIGFIKPNASRPANSERYIVCKSRELNVSPLVDYLSRANCRLADGRSGDTCGAAELVQLVPLTVLFSDAKFTQFITETNNRLVTLQTRALRHMAVYADFVAEDASGGASTTQEEDDGGGAEAAASGGYGGQTHKYRYERRRRVRQQLRTRDWCLQAWQLPEEQAASSCSRPPPAAGAANLQQLSASRLIKKLHWSQLIGVLLDALASVVTELNGANRLSPTEQRCQEQQQQSGRHERLAGAESVCQVVVCCCCCHSFCCPSSSCHQHITTSAPVSASANTASATANTANTASANTATIISNHLCLLMGQGHSAGTSWCRPIMTRAVSSSRSGRWRQVCVQLPLGTLLLAEPVQPSTAPSTGQCAGDDDRWAAGGSVWHVLDVFWLAGDDVTQLPFCERQRLLQLFIATAVRCRDSCRHGNSSCPTDCGSCVHLKQLPPLTAAQLPSLADRLCVEEADGSRQLVYRHGVENSQSTGHLFSSTVPAVGGLIINTDKDCLSMWSSAVFWPWWDAATCRLCLGDEPVSV